MTLKLKSDADVGLIKALSKQYCHDKSTRHLLGILLREIYSWGVQAGMVIT